MQVSIILVSYNTKDLTRNCINSIYEKTKNLDFEIYVVDNNSHDGSAEMIENEFPNVKLIKNTENKGFGAANNIAIKQCCGKYVFLLNTDTLLVNNAINIFYDFMEKPENQAVGCCGGNLYDEEMKRGNSFGFFPNLLYLFLIVFFLRNIFSKLFKNYYDNRVTYHSKDEIKQITSFDYISGADLFIRKSVLNEIGLFDEDFFMYFEETELCFRIKKKNYKIIALPDSVIMHFECKSFDSNSNLKRLKIFKESEYKFFKKCNGLLSAKTAKILYFFLYLRYYLITKDKHFLDLLAINYKTPA